MALKKKYCLTSKEFVPKDSSTDRVTEKTGVVGRTADREPIETWTFGTCDVAW